MTGNDFIGAIIQELAEVLGVRTVGQQPDDDTVVDSPLLVVERVGGTADERGIRDTPLVEVSAWNVSKKKSHDLANQARKVLLELPPRFRGFFVYRTQDVSGVEYAPATASRAYQHRATVAITIRGIA
jgi:hypothetical protein